MEDEIRKVLNLVKEGKISPEEGEKLILAIKESIKHSQSTKKGKFLRIQIQDGNDKLNIKVPILLIKLGLKFVPQETFKVELNGRKVEIPAEEVIDELLEGTTELVELEDENGAFIKIWIE